MLIDASHAEETRVVVAHGTRLEEFDFEINEKKQLKGNIYLAKVMRVEPSLQAAFVEYGGNRHGFLPFGEIHPDYYQIPVEDKEALFEEQQAAIAEDGEEEYSEAETNIKSKEAEHSVNVGSSALLSNPAHENKSSEIGKNSQFQTTAKNGDDSDNSEGRRSDAVETLGGDDLDEEARRRLSISRSLLSRRYKIQEVIKKRQIMLIQVVKEERGNKGAALTTYLSLAGRYCVLMPNAVRGGGISRKIVNSDDRKRLRTITKELKVPPRMAMIVRTAGLARTRVEIKRDFEYLLRQWESIRQDTLESSAPVLINEEANLIRRSIRDLYSRDIEQILIEGDSGYRVAKDFMRTLIPSHSSKVQPYRDRIPLFARYQIESQLDAVYSAEVQLKSGGYLVINPTEALVSIDVNSGRATKQRTIEATALKTNQEASDEIARQLRLRDLAGLIVIDFIDMDESRNQRTIERRLKEAMRYDRARIQVGRISPFGLLELSRQRLRPSLFESATEKCQVCSGMGGVRSISSSAVHVLRALEEEGLRGRSSAILVSVPNDIALYIFNFKRKDLNEIETLYNLSIAFKEDPNLIPPMYNIEVLTGKDESPLKTSTANQEISNDIKGSKENQRNSQSLNGRKKNSNTSKSPNNRQDNAKEEKLKNQQEQDSPNITARVADESTEDNYRDKRKRRGRRGGRRRNPRSRKPSDNYIDSKAQITTNNEPDLEVSGNTVVANIDENSLPPASSNVSHDNEKPTITNEGSDGSKRKLTRKPRRKTRKSKNTDKALTKPDEILPENEIVGNDIPNKNSGIKEIVKVESQDKSGDENISNKNLPYEENDNTKEKKTEKPSTKARRSGWWQRTTT